MVDRWVRRESPTAQRMEMTSERLDGVNLTGAVGMTSGSVERWHLRAESTSIVLAESPSSPPVKMDFSTDRGGGAWHRQSLFSIQTGLAPTLGYASQEIAGGFSEPQKGLQTSRQGLALCSTHLFSNIPQISGTSAYPISLEPPLTTRWKIVATNELKRNQTTTSIRTHHAQALPHRNQTLQTRDSRESRTAIFRLVPV